MKKSDFYFDLPERLIAQHPLEQRDASRLMVLDRRDGSVTHRHFRDLLEYVQPGDCMVFNNSCHSGAADGSRSRPCYADRGAAAD